MKSRLIDVALTCALAGLLAGCSVYDSVSSYIGSDSASKCPDAAILANTASLPAFNPSAEGDPSGVIYTIAMTDVSSRCSYDKSERTADTRLKIELRAQRPPGAGEVNYRVPYYVAVTSGGELLDKKLFWLEFTFPAGAVTTDAEEVIESEVVKFAKDKMPYDYHFLVGFQLTKAQLEYNKKMGQYAP
ncbi:MAG: hypothetical protein KGM97_09975 [Alphaproteobacteria bacterium]|nr:hypothetical protein [Alphaproteobacteria bacterium]MDE2631303.1 hypothetical protein [Alphaproteobacteria bacterium]